MIKQLRRNFVITAMTIVTIILIIVISSVLISTYNQMKNDALDSISKSDNIMHIGENVDSSARRDFVPIMFRNRPITIIKLSENNEITNIYGNFVVEQDEVQPLIDRIINANGMDGVIPSESIIYLKKNFNETTKIIISDFTQEIESFTRFTINLLIVVAITIIVLLFISIFLARKVTQPVEKAWNQQKQFLSDASHELKTPLTVVLANTSILMKKKNMSSDEASKWIGLINDEALRMKKMVDDLFFLAKSDENALELTMSKNNLSDIITESVLMFEPIAFDKNISFDSNIDSDIFINCDTNLIKQLSFILLDNAFKYCNKNGKVIIRLERNDKTAQLTVLNTGNYIPSEDIEHIFDRFYKVDKSRIRNNSSHGLGLAIANEITSKHNGIITVESNEQIGTKFIVKLNAL